MVIETAAKAGEAAERHEPDKRTWALSGIGGDDRGLRAALPIRCWWSPPLRSHRQRAWHASIRSRSSRPSARRSTIPAMSAWCGSLIALLERHGLQERARVLIEGMKGATFARLLTGYLLLRQLTAALGLTSIIGHAQTVRRAGRADGQGSSRSAGQATREEVRALAAATDNVGLFFGEDVFIAIGSIC